MALSKNQASIILLFEKIQLTLNDVSEFDNTTCICISQSAAKCLSEKSVFGKIKNLFQKAIKRLASSKKDLRSYFPEATQDQKKMCS